MAHMQQAPDINSYSLGEFFFSSYQVPRYQRNYTWKDEQVLDLVNDLLEFFDSGEPFYLLGDVIAANTGIGSQYQYELIDGQQRSTTLIILFSVIYQRLVKWGFTQDDTNQLYNAMKQDAVHLKVKMSGGASQVVLDYLLDEDLTKLPKASPSQANVVAAYEALTKRLDEEFLESNKDQLLKFTKRILRDVYLGRLTLLDVDQATQFFERVNHRGVGLTDADLLKNRLLQNISDDVNYEFAASVWDTAEKFLMAQGKQGSLEFLIRQIRQADLGEKVQDKKLFEKTKSEVSDDEKCLNFIDRIESKYTPLKMILTGKMPSGSTDPHGDGTRFFGFTQNYCVKLAASHLNDESFGWLSKRLEGRAILSLLANERSQAYEKQVPVWAKKVQDLPEDATENQIADAISCTPADLDQLHTIAYQLFSALRYDGTPGQLKRIRYVLARVNHVLNERGPSENLSLADFLVTSKTTKRKQFPGFDIEHIKPKAAPGFSEDFEFLGNLTLLHTFDNQVEGANPPPAKDVSYGHSKCYATRALTKNFQQPPHVENVIAPYRVAVIDDGTEWDLYSVEARLEMYWEILSIAIGDDLNYSFNL